jgi:hypothetical protein
MRLLFAERNSFIPQKLSLQNKSPFIVALGILFSNDSHAA